MIFTVAKLLMPREQAKKMLAERIRSGKDVDAKAEVAVRTYAYNDWLQLFAKWRDETIDELKAAYEGIDIWLEFDVATKTYGTETSSKKEFERRREATRDGIQKLEHLIERLALVVPQSPDATAIDSLHPEILSRCRGLFESGNYAEAVEKGFKIVRDRLRALTGYERGFEAFGSKGKLYIEGAAAPHLDKDFQEAVKFLTMAIDFFRNEKSHFADGNISDPVRAYEYLRLSSLAMGLLERARVPDP
jgi:uncharacterized protein (TIGR02391 family)